MSKTIENLKSGNYEVVDNQGVSVTTHFIECLEKELANFIEPKFKIGQKVWVVDNLSEKIYLGEVDFIEAQKFKKGNIIWYQVEYFDKCTMSGPFEEPFTFATKEEARAKLEELKNG